MRELFSSIIYRIIKSASKKLGINIYYKQRYYNHLVSKQFRDLESYLSLYENLNNKRTLNISQEICFSKTIPFGSLLKDAKSELREYDYHITNHNASSLDILIFKRMIGGLNVKCQMHFFENELFLYNYTFSHINKEKKNEILNILHQKYAPNADYITNQNIKDEFNNCIAVEDSVELQINYLSLNSPFFHKLVSFQEDEETQTITQYIRSYKKIYDFV